MAVRRSKWNICVTESEAKAKVQGDAGVRGSEGRRVSVELYSFVQNCNKCTRQRKLMYGSFLPGGPLVLTLSQLQHRHKMFVFSASASTIESCDSPVALTLVSLFWAQP